jgi:glutathione S-transferase
MRARMAIASAKVNCALREIVLRDKPDHMLAISPKGTVPVLQIVSGDVIDESLDIALWALNIHDPEHMLMPEGGNVDVMHRLISDIDAQFKPLLDQYKYQFHADPDFAKGARDGAIVALRKLNQRLEGNAFLFGAKISLADICVLPFVRQFAFVDKDWFWKQDFTNVIVWLDGFLASDRFAGIMTKHPVWKYGDPVTVFPPVVC